MLKKCCLVIIALFIAFCGTIRVVPKAYDATGATVVAVKETQAAAPKNVSVNPARFLNMLNRNFVYGEDFDSAEQIVNGACVALLDKADSDGFINALYVTEYLKNMFGASFENLDELSGDAHYKKGFVYVMPRGFTSYEHTDAKVSENLDGTYTVITKVALTAHDGESSDLTAITHFVKNDASIFGYSIISSELVSGAECA